MYNVHVVQKLGYYSTILLLKVRHENNNLA